MGSYEMPTNCKWVNIKCNAMPTLGIFNSYEKDLEFFRQFKICKRCLNDMEIRGGGSPFQKKILIFKTLALYFTHVR